MIMRNACWKVEESKGTRWPTGRRNLGKTEKIWTKCEVRKEKIVGAKEEHQEEIKDRMGLPERSHR